MRMRHCCFPVLWLLAAASGGVQAACGVDTVGVAFGSYEPISGQPVDGVGSVVVTCSPAASYSISLSSGTGSYIARQLSATSSSLLYNLYSNPGHSMVWGDGTAGTVTVEGTGTGDTHSVYGRIPGGQTGAAAGVYSDLVVVTVDF